jgi:esterase/lipase
LIIHGGKDGLTPPAAGQWMFDHLGTSDKTFILYEEAGHTVFLGPTASQFNKDVEVFLESK